MTAALAKRHLMPLIALVTFVAAAAPAGRAGLGHLAFGTALMTPYWLVEWPGVEGTFENRVPRHPLIRVEEQILSEHFGEQWTAHAKRTWALLPPLW